MANKGTLFDLKKFRFGSKSEQKHTLYNVKGISGISDGFVNYSNKYAQIQNVEAIYRKNINQGTRDYNTNFYTSPVRSGNIANYPISNLDYNRTFVSHKRALPNNPDGTSPYFSQNVPEFILKHPAFNKAKYILGKRYTLPLKKCRIKDLEADKNKLENFCFVWEAFPKYSANDIYIIFDYYNWNMESTIQHLSDKNEIPVKPLVEDALRDFLEESDDEFMEDDDSHERLARAEFDMDEYNFIMDYNGSTHPMAFMHSHQTPFNPANANLSHPYTYNIQNLHTNAPASIYNNVNHQNISPVNVNPNDPIDKQFYNDQKRKAGDNVTHESNIAHGANNPNTNSNSGTVDLMDEDNEADETNNLEISLDYGAEAYYNVKEGNRAYGSMVQKKNLGYGSRGGLERDLILDFFNTSTKEELLSLKHCSLKKCEIVMQNRPFVSWEELNAKFERFKFLSVELIQSAKKMLYVRRQIVKLLQHCEQLSSELQRAVENMMSRGHMVVQPSKLISDHYSLKPYQVAGINWLNLLFKMGMNGILADEMGLGKTVQILAFLQFLLENGIKGPILIIVPASTLDNWTSEISIWCPVSKITIYYGSQSERKDQRFFLTEENGLQQLDIILTTYAMVSSTADDKNFFKRILFTYVIFDEAHMLKNMTSIRYKYLMKIKAKYRVLLTGTPIQNNLMELMSLMQFILPDKIFEEKTEELKTVFSAYELNVNAAINLEVGKTAAENGKDGGTGSDNELEEDNNDGNVSGSIGKRKPDKRQRSQFEMDRVEQAKRIVRPFVLRRTKAQVLDQLPPKIQEITLCDMTPDQALVYKGVLNNYKEQLAKNASNSLNNSNVLLPPMNILIQLRKAANHPLMLRNAYSDDLLRQMSVDMLNEPTHKHAVPDLIYEDMKVLSDFELYKLTKAFPSISGYKLPNHVIKACGKFEFLDTILPQIVNKNEKGLIFSQFTLMLDILQEYLSILDYKFMRIDGATPVPDRLSLIKAFTNDKDCPFFLLSTKAGGLGINLTCANHVIIYDIDINPYNDKQAEDRCHRVGQEKTVSVNRLISKDTIEELILRCNKEKLKLEESMTGVGKQQNSQSSGMILGGNDVFEGVNSDNLNDENNDDIANLLKMAVGS
ncbi:unnamed protein product [Gordionus sp. m RMFG-2023]|uniref:SWI/SNF-related matrix-associated actin-dependent regulator of chromatin subfamily A containing DEAD/H box 1B-like n=1 Tax=Gordionus sp. m RMFG-2023 TaxID=3053472 RepID=UPI0030E4B546